VQSEWVRLVRPATRYFLRSRRICRLHYVDSMNEHVKKKHLARAKVWEDFRIEGCRVLTGMRTSCTLIEHNSLWFEGSDGSHLFVSVHLGLDWVRRAVGRVFSAMSDKQTP